MLLESLITTYGYWALLVGTFFEGETILIIGGFLAYQGYLRLPLVILAGFMGSLLGDQLLFFIGRHRGRTFLEGRTDWQARSKRIRELLDRYQILVIIGFRFVYGFRTVTPFVLGMSRVKTRIFAILNACSALLWAVVVGTGGFVFGRALEIFLGDLRRYELRVILGIGVAGLGLWLFHVLRKRSSALKNQ